MTDFLDDDYLLTTDTAWELYRIAEAEQIVDVHNHLVPAEIAEDRTWDTITDLWLADDHYKWRAMRLAGIDEERITGDVDPLDRFRAWAATMPRLLGNPLYIWTHLELKRAFGVDVPLSPATADRIYAEVNEQLPEKSARTLLDEFGVEFVATTDSPPDDLAHHATHAASGSSPRLAPTFRPDRAHEFRLDPGEWNTWVDALAGSEGLAIDDLDSLIAALTSAHGRFRALGCRASDHGLAALPDRGRNQAQADQAIRRARACEPIEPTDADAVMLEVLHLTAQLAVEHDMVMQLHLGPLRNVSPSLMDRVGRDAGADVMGDVPQAAGLAGLLGDLDAGGHLPRTVLYNLNPADNELFVTMAGAFARGGTESHVQWGPPWWFNDHEEGMRRQLDVLSQIGQLAGFVGMLTDSRSILSMTRHELFRRVLCAKIGDAVAAGSYPADLEFLGELVRGICAGNAKRFFGIG
ncbi:MAG: glucuronate isomerase [Actinomycetota bacterium]